MSLARRLAAVPVAFLLAGLLVACGGDGGGETTDTTTEVTEVPTTQATATSVSITAKDYSFDVPATFKGGLVKLSYANAGKEPHFAAFAKIAAGKSLADVKATLTAPPSATPPSGPPPFENVAAFPTADPGVSGAMAVNLPAGSYAFYCLIPAADGVPHAAKGMIQEVTVSQGTDGALPASAGTVKAVDFGLSGVPALKAGSNTVRLSNQGKQLHEINLVELNSGKTLDDLVAWAKEESGPPPVRFLTGAAVKPGSDATAELDLVVGRNYAFVCMIPDFLGDFAPHITKGMRTSVITVT
ncbi:MAG: hypothetical protein ACRD0Q_05935 [Acidimicrobiales bacterium]